MITRCPWWNSVIQREQGRRQYEEISSREHSCGAPVLVIVSAVHSGHAVTKLLEELFWFQLVRCPSGGFKRDIETAYKTTHVGPIVGRPDFDLAKVLKNGKPNGRNCL